MDKWPCLQACVDKLQRQHERKFSFPSFFSFVPDDRPILISEYHTNVSCKPKQTCLDTHDVVVTTSASFAKTFVVLALAPKLSYSCCVYRIVCRGV